MTTFNDTETSEMAGLAVTLYQFKRANKSWYYTDADRDINYPNADDDHEEDEPWIAVPISDEGISQSGDSSNDDVAITLPATVPIVPMYRGSVPSDSMLITIRRWHYGETVAPIVWVGNLIQVSRPDTASAKLTCQSFDASFKREGLRLAWQRACPHMLYGPGCTVVKALFAVSATVETVSGGRVTAEALAAKPTGWFNGGFFSFVTTDGFTEYRPIESSDGNYFDVFTSSEGVTVGMDITVYPGCTRTVNDCNDKFDNLPNYGGFPHMPGTSPFDGNPVF